MFTNQFKRMLSKETDRVDIELVLSVPRKNAGNVLLDNTMFIKQYKDKQILDEAEAVNTLPGQGISFAGGKKRVSRGDYMKYIG